MNERQEEQFVEILHRITCEIHFIAKCKGFWEDARTDGDLVALVMTELSKYYEGLRQGNPPSEHIPEFSLAEEELADVVIRVLNIAYKRGHRIAEAMLAKMKFNKTRPYKHGKKF